MEKLIGLITCNYSAQNPRAPERHEAHRVHGPTSAAIALLTSRSPIWSTAAFARSAWSCRTTTARSSTTWDQERTGTSIVRTAGLFILPGSAFGTSRTGSRFLLRDLIHNKVYFERSGADADGSSPRPTSSITYRSQTRCSRRIRHRAPTSRSSPRPPLTRMSMSPGLTCRTGASAAFTTASCLAIRPSSDCFIVSRQLLLDMFDWYNGHRLPRHLRMSMQNDFERVNVQTYTFGGYAAPVFNKTAYFRSNMDTLLDPHIFGRAVPTRGASSETKAHDTAPAKNEVGSHVTNSLVSAGCRIFGSVSGSVLGRNVIVESGATIRDSVIMQGLRHQEWCAHRERHRRPQQTSCRPVPSSGEPPRTSWSRRRVGARAD